MKKLIFFIPLLYLYFTRIKNPLKLLSWSGVYTIPVITLFFFENAHWHFTIDKILYVLLSILTVDNFYEIGYIQNDTETIKKETNPTKRISDDLIQYYRNHKSFIYLVRFVIGLFLIYILTTNVSFLGSILFTVSIFILLLTYALYNHFRGHINMLLYFILVSLRHCSGLLLFPENLSWNIILLGIMVYPIVKTVEYGATKPVSNTTNIFFRKYIIKFDKNRLPIYRVVAYLVLLMISYFLYYWGYFTFPYFCLIFYMFVLRFILFIVLKCVPYLRSI